MIKTYIDGADIFNDYGILVADGGFAGLISLPPMDSNAIPQNDWFEYNGIEVPSKITPEFSEKQFQMPFIATDFSKINDFIDFLMSKTYHLFTSDMFVLEYGGFNKIRYISCSAISYVGNSLARFTINFSDDSRTFFVNSDGYYNLFGVENDYFFDSLNWGKIGITVLSGTNAEILKAAKSKENYINESIGNYNSGAMKYQTNDINLKLHICSDKTALNTKDYKIKAFWSNYYYFAWKLIYQNTMKAIINGKTYNLTYLYNSCNVSRFYALQNWAFWIDFNINITTTK